MDIPALGADGEYRPRKHDTVRDCAGAAVAELSMVAPLYIARTVDAQRQLPPLPPHACADQKGIALPSLPPPGARVFWDTQRS